MVERIAITGLGIVGAPGSGVAATREAVRAGRSGLGPLELFESQRCGHFPVGQVRGVELEADLPRTVSLAKLAAREALESAGWSAVDEHLSTEFGISLGTCVGGMPETEGAVRDLLAGGEPEPSVWATHECGATTALLADELALRGPSFTLSTACSSGAQAIACGADLLQAGGARAVLAGGVDGLCHLTLNGFASLLAMDPEGCRPFDRARAGMSLGEGAAFVVLEREADATERGARPLAFLAGFGNTCDAHHATAPHPEGEGAERAIRAALARAEWELGSVDYVSAHGTGTRDNDLAEGRALRRVFGTDLPPVSSVKRVFGHTLAAAGAIEAIVSVLALQEGFLPPNPGCTELDEEIGIEPIRECRAANVRRVLSSSFGFGGNNTVLCLEGGGETR